MSVAEEPAAGAMTMIDEAYEFSAPRFFDFIKGETEEEMRKAELWFDKALSYAPSPFMPRIKKERSFKVESMCDFSEAAVQMQKAPESSGKKTEEASKETTDGNRKPNGDLTNEVSADNVAPAEASSKLVYSQECERKSSSTEVTEPARNQEKSKSPDEVGSLCTPKPVMSFEKGFTDSKKKQTAKKIASMVKNTSSALRPKNQLQSSQVKSTKPASVKRDPKVKNFTGTPNLQLENQAIKRQKLDGGKSRQILNIKPQHFPHKSKLGLTSSTCTPTAANRAQKENRKVYALERQTAEPFVSVAEMMRKFNSSTRDLSLPSASHDAAGSMIQNNKPKLTLTRPKEPEFITSQRVRAVRVKSTAELEEEMMAKIPKFKARPLNKKILEAPTLPASQRSTPQPPEFQEFHLETMARANQHAETSSVASTEVSVSSRQSQWKPRLTAPKSPVLQTLLRARPPTAKSSEELEQEKLEKAPKFKARPLNKKIFESKGELGIFSNAKKHVTVPQEFHLSINERIPLPASIFDSFDKLSLNSESRHDKPPLPRNTMPNPFHLHTEERGAEKQKKFVMEFVHKQFEEERAKVPKANPYPYTTDYPTIPPKPEPKPCTKPEPFQLESLMRHEEEMQRELEERLRKEKEEEEMRKFKARPILKEDPIPLPERVRKPLTEVQGFNLALEHRAVERQEFDQKIKEKEMEYKRYREESEAQKQLEDERALKQLRRTLVPHARPVPNFDRPFLPQKVAKETTKAKAPHLRVLQRRERRKTALMNAVSSSTSAAAANMR